MIPKEHHRRGHGGRARPRGGDSRGDREGREVRGRRQARVGGQRLRRAGRRSRQGRQESLRAGFREGGLRAQGRRGVAARADARSASTSFASTSTRATRSSLRHILVSIQASDSAIARVDARRTRSRDDAANSEQGAKLDTAARALKLAEFKVQAFEDQPAVLARPRDSERERMGVRRRQGRRNERPVRRRQRLLPRPPRLAACRRRAEVREREGRGARPRRRCSAPSTSSFPKRRRLLRPRRPAARWKRRRSRRARRSRQTPMFARSSMVAGPRPVHRADRRRVRPAGWRGEPAGEVGRRRLRPARRQARGRGQRGMGEAEGGAAARRACSSFASRRSRCSCRTFGRRPRSTTVARTFRPPRAARRPDRTEARKGGIGIGSRRE